MRKPAVTALLSQTEDIASLVLEAERAALGDVEHCRRQALRLLTLGLLRAQLVRKRSEVRVRLIRERMKLAARNRQLQISSDMEALAGDMGSNVPVLAPVDKAIARVAEELAGISASN